MKFSDSDVVSPGPVVQVQVAVEVNLKDTADLPKLIIVAGLKHVLESDLCIQTWIAYTGEHIVAGTGDCNV